ncbi:transglycosylase SLT domain-containing protein [Comamonas koreensis]|uniref:transglycosylase SLT domain-containing protein n=1 Tax=Comamonas koreensis TaxID=160825 RepID=UPI0015FC5DE6|nr:transglycosylase SLT domain-containing protein [Comamonas koreensis]
MSRPGIGHWVACAIALLCGNVMAQAIPAAALQYRAQLTREAQFRFGIPAPVPAIAGQIHQESLWRAQAVSRTGALGLMQFMPATAKWANEAAAWGAVEPLNPTWSIRAGVWYDRWLYDRVKGHTECDRWNFALSSYNGGLGWTNRRKARSPDPLSWQATGFINPGILASNQHENETYSPKILLKHQLIYSSWGRTVCH